MKTSQLQQKVTLLKDALKIMHDTMKVIISDPIIKKMLIQRYDSVFEMHFERMKQIESSLSALESIEQEGKEAIMPLTKEKIIEVLKSYKEDFESWAISADEKGSFSHSNETQFNSICECIASELSSPAPTVDETFNPLSFVEGFRIDLYEDNSILRRRGVANLFCHPDDLVILKNNLSSKATKQSEK